MIVVTRRERARANFMLNCENMAISLHWCSVWWGETGDVGYG